MFYVIREQHSDPITGRIIFEYKNTLSSHG